MEHCDQEASCGVAVSHPNLGKRTSDARGLKSGETQSQYLSLYGNV
jgi:hypothetical protein